MESRINQDWKYKEKRNAGLKDVMFSTWQRMIPSMTKHSYTSFNPNIRDSSRQIERSLNVLQEHLEIIVFMKASIYLLITYSILSKILLGLTWQDKFLKRNFDSGSINRFVSKLMPNTAMVM